MNAFKVAMIASGLLVIAGCQQPAEDTTADVTALEKMAPAWADAYNAADVDALANMYWEDAVLQPPGVPSAEGRTAIRAYLASDTAGAQGASLRMNIPTAGSVDVSGDLGYEAGTFTVTNATGAIVDQGKYLGVFQKRDGQWKYIRDTWNSDNLRAPAAEPMPCCDESGAMPGAAPAPGDSPAAPTG